MSRSKRNGRRSVGAWLAIAGIVAGVGVMAPGVARAAGLSTWTGAGATNNWSDAANWDTPPSAGSDLIFPDVADALWHNTVNDTPAGTMYSSITILESGYVLSGNSIMLDFAVFAQFNSGVSTVDFSTVLSTSGQHPIDVAAGGTLNVSGQITGAGGIVKTDDGLALLSSQFPNRNTYVGSTNITEGTLAIADSSALGNSTSGNGTVVSSGATLEIRGTINTSEPVTITGDGAGGVGALYNGSGNNVVQSVTLAGAGSIGVATGTFMLIPSALNQSVPNSPLDKTGSGTLDVLATTTFTGQLNVVAGTLAVEGNVNTIVEVLPGATLAIAGGKVSEFHVQPSGTVTPGFSTYPYTGTTDAFSLDDAATFFTTLTGANPGNGTIGYGRLVDTGTANIDGTLSVSLGGGYVPAAGAVHTIISAGLAVGEFNGLAEGAKFAVGGSTFRISYLGNAVTLTALTTTTTTLSSSVNPADPGQAITLTASITDTAPTGFVSFYDGATLLGSAAVVSDAATLTTSALSSGTHSLTATYSGNSTHAPSTSGPLAQLVRSAPVAVDDSYLGTEDILFNVAAPGVLDNDDDDDGDTLSASVVTSPTNGTLDFETDGSFTYLPNANFNGTDFFTYEVSDGALGSSPATVVLSVMTNNDAPGAAADNYFMVEGEGAVYFGSLLTNDSDPDDADVVSDDDDIVAVQGSSPEHGTVTMFDDASGTFLYTPTEPDYTGTDSFTYRAYDGSSYSPEATVTITISPVNDGPVAVDDSFAAAEDTAYTSSGSVLDNDDDVDGDSLTAVLIAGAGNGTLALNADGTFAYTAAANYSGTDTFTYRAYDGTLLSNTVTVTIDVAAVDDIPAATFDSYAVAEDTTLDVAAPGVLANDSDADGETVTAQLLTGPSHGTLTLRPDGSFTYVPDANFNGDDSFNYQAAADTNSSGAGVRAEAADGATVTITVTAVNDAPVAPPVAPATTPNGTPLVVAAPGPLAGATDAEGDPLTAVLVSGPSNGTLVLNADGSYIYTPNAGFAGTDAFSYAASDGTAQSAAVTVTVVAQAAVVPPVTPTPVPPATPAPTPAPPLTTPSGDLPATGADIFNMLLLAGVVVTAGVVLSGVRRRRPAA